MEMLGSIDAKPHEAKNKIEHYLQSSAELKSSTLESFLKPKNMSLESLIQYFVPSERLRRAEQIDDVELTIQEQDGGRIKAVIRGYHIVIDREAATIAHDCADWERVLTTKKLCKHVAKLLLSLDSAMATEILRKMYAEQDKWKFIAATSE
jgi:hypothetical protein